MKLIFAPSRAALLGAAALAPFLLASCKRPAATPGVRAEPSTQTTSEPAGQKPPPSGALPSAIVDNPAYPLLKSGSLSLVSEGKAHSAIILSSEVDEGVRADVRYFASLVEKATGAALRIVNGEEEPSLDQHLIRIFIGNSPQAASLGLRAEDLPEEGYRIVTCENALFILGDPREPRVHLKSPATVSRPTFWALKELLEQGLGVRWLWPGDLGTYVPRSPQFAVAAMERSYQPRLNTRILRMTIPKSMRGPLSSADKSIDEQLCREAVRWADVHECGVRGTVDFEHAFEKWWERYSKDHPDYFAELPPGYEHPFPSAGFVKLRLSNPKVIEQIAAEHREAGSPDYWNLSPNDGSGFDVSPETLAWDIPQGQNLEDIVKARGNLTARYIKFWNLVYERLKQQNPQVTIGTYAYSSYRMPPPPERPLTAKAAIQFVDGLEAYEGWDGWAAQGVDLYLRPNWWYQGAAAPYLSLNATSNFLKHAFEHRMRGIEMDSILGYWAAQGPNYYLVARMMTRPDLSKDAIVNEYTSAFGAGAAKIRQYIAYWERLADRYCYPINAGGAPKGHSEFMKLVAEKKLPNSVLNGSTYALPLLYPESVVTPAEVYLTEAEKLIGTNDPEALQRVAFLRRGLENLRITRSQVEAGQRLKRERTKENLKAFLDGEKEFMKAREELSRDHTNWGALTTRYEKKYGILMGEEALKRNHINLDGM